MARANSSLPVPVSPRMSTVVSAGATWRTSASTWSRRRAAADDLPGAPELAQLGAQVLGLVGQGDDAPLGLEPLVDVAQDEREVLAAVELEQRQRRLGGEGAPARASCR